MSNSRCCVPGCNRTGSSETLHKFPNPEKNKDLFNTWLYSIDGDLLGLENEHIFKYRRVCHRHFEAQYLCRYNRISNVAVPTLYMPGPTSLPTFSLSTRTPLSLRNEPVSNEPSSSQGAAMQLRSEIGEDIEMKENIEPSSSQGAALQLHSEIGKDIEMKENIEPVKVVSSLNIETQQQHSQSYGPDEQIKNCPMPQVGISRIMGQKRKRAAATPSERALYKKLVGVGVKLSKCRNNVKRQALQIRTLKNISTNPQFLKALDNLSSSAKLLTMMQFRESKKKDQGRRFTNEEKILALSILKQSPKGYRFLRKIFILPAQQTLIKLINAANIKPGLNENITKQIKKATDKMTIKERLCVLLFDEMSLKANVTYNERKDKVSGFVTNGQETQAEYADHAQVFMIRGLIKKYKQPVAYTFSQAATKGPELAKQLKAVITELQAAGLIVVATICDQGTNNVNCIKMLIEETRANLLRDGKEPRGNIFMVNGEIIIPLYDPPHLIKGIRNNLLTKDLKFRENNKEKKAKWQHIENLHQENPGYKGLRMVPKLTDNHVLPHKVNKMKVKFATQIFSKTVAVSMGYLADKGILPADSRDTADILLFFDELFDSVNGSFEKKKHGKPLLGPATPNSVHGKLWIASKKKLKEMKFVNRTTGQVEHVPTLNNWVWTLEGIEVLLRTVKEKYEVTSVWLRHLNQDPIENFFGAVRSHGCRNTNPTTERFESTFTTLLINSLSSVHAPGANCEEDNCKILQQLLITSECEAPPCEMEFIPEIVFTSLENKKDPREIGILQYVSGYFVKKTQTNIFKGCTQCKKNLLSQKEAEYIKYREYCAGKRWLCTPSDPLLRCISDLQDIINQILKTSLEKNNLKEFIKTMAFATVEFDFINCQTHREKNIEYLINLCCRFFIFNYCKEINKILCNRREYHDEDDNYKIKAKKYFQKCFKKKNK